MTDIKSALRKLQFPQSVSEALKHLQKLLVTPNRNDATIQVLKQDVVNNFILIDYSLKTEKLLPKQFAIRELHILYLVTTALSNSKSESGHELLFHALFPSGDISLLEHRKQFFANLVCLNLSIKNKKILDSSALFMHICGTYSPLSVYVVQTIITECFESNVSSVEAALTLVSASPLFCATFLTTAAFMFPVKPPPCVFKLLICWLGTKPDLAFVPLNQVGVAAQTFISGLAGWVTMSDIDADVAVQLHLKLLESLRSVAMQFKKPPPLLTVPQLIKIAESLNEESALREDCVDRLAQIVQIAAAAKCIQGQFSQLRQVLQSIPGDHKLLHLVLSRNTL